MAINPDELHALGQQADELARQLQRPANGHTPLLRSVKEVQRCKVSRRTHIYGTHAHGRIREVHRVRTHGVPPSVKLVRPGEGAAQLRD